MMELVDTPGRSTIFRICRLWTYNPKQAGGGFRGPFCDPTEGILKFWVGELFVWGVTHSGKKTPVVSGTGTLF